MRLINIIHTCIWAPLYHLYKLNPTNNSQYATTPRTIRDHHPCWLRKPRQRFQSLVQKDWWNRRHQTHNWLQKLLLPNDQNHPRNINSQWTPERICSKSPRNFNVGRNGRSFHRNGILSQWLVPRHQWGLAFVRPCQNHIVQYFVCHEANLSLKRNPQRPEALKYSHKPRLPD